MFTDAELVATMTALKKFALRLTMNATNAEDLTQETLLRMIEKRGMYVAQDGGLFSWGSKIMFNIFATGYRKMKKFETQYDPEPYIAAVQFDAGMDETVDARLCLKTLKRMPEHHRSILERVSIGQTYEEIAAELQINTGTVRSRLHRARTQFLIHLHDRNYDQPKPSWLAAPRPRRTRVSGLIRIAFRIAAFVPFTTPDGQLRAAYTAKAVNDFFQGEST